MGNLILIMNGAPGVGKTSIAQRYKEAEDDLGEDDVHILSTVDYVKSVAVALGWDGIKTDKSRKFLSELKQILCEWNDSPNTWVINNIKALNKDASINHAYFIDCREPSQIDHLKDLARELDNTKVFTILVRREKAKLNISNSSDADVENYNYDIYLNNDSSIEAAFIDLCLKLKKLGAYN